MQVGVLGPLIIRDGPITVPAGGAVQRRILARLALEPGRPVAFDDLEVAAWGDNPPAASRHTIASHVFRLRRLGIEIDTTDDRYALRTPTDFGEVTRLAGDSRSARVAGDASRARACIEEALGLARGRPFDDLDDLPEATIAAARVEELIEGLREDRLAFAIDTDASPEVIADARRLVADHPYRERRWELLMLALYRSGRQAEALDAYAECRRRLLDDLGLDPGASLRRMQQAVLAQDFALDGPTTGGSDDATAATTSRVAGRVHAIPGTSTRLIGRSVEQRDLGEAWERTRLVSIVGPPGAGKTRLALEFARSAPSAWYVDLEQVPASRAVAAAVLEVVEPSSHAADASDGAAQAIGAIAGLLVLDGAEARQAEVAREAGLLLAACPSLRILVTTRERLGLRDEALLPLGPLDADDAVALLVDRARLLDPHFRLADGEAVAAARLCALVDRLPLGIELVARHLHLLRVDEVVSRVEADLPRWAGGPAGGRPGLWAALDGSVDRLGPEERRALAALAVMAADADLAMVDEVAAFEGDGTDAFEVVARLVDASLVQVRSAVGPTRYELLRTVAAYTLATAGDPLLLPARERYRAVVLERASALARRLVGAERSETLRRLDREMPHVEAQLGALAEAGQTDRARRLTGLELAVALTDYWLGRQPAEGLERIGRLVDAADPEPPLRAAAQLARGHLAYWVTDFAFGAALVDESRALYAALGDPLGEGRALRRRGAIAAATDDLPAAREYLEASLERLEAAGVEREIGTTLLHLGSLLADEGFADEALSALERSRAIAVATGDPLAHGHALSALTLACWKAGRLDAAMQAGTQALLIFRELGHRPTEGTVAYQLSAVARGLHRPRAARRYAEVALDAGRRTHTRTTVAIGNLDLARLDLDAGDRGNAASHLLETLALIDPDADRWVLVDALEAAARLIVVTDGDLVLSQGDEPTDAVTTAAALLATSATVRSDIHQPIAPTEADDLAWTRARLPGTLTRAVGDATPDTATALAMAVSAVRAVLSALPPPAGARRTIRTGGG